MICTNMKKILSHQVDLGHSMLDVKYKELGCSGLVTTPLNMAPNLSECNISHAGIAPQMNLGMDTGRTNWPHDTPGVKYGQFLRF